MRALEEVRERLAFRRGAPSSKKTVGSPSEGFSGGVGAAYQNLMSLSEPLLLIHPYPSIGISLPLSLSLSLSNGFIFIPKRIASCSKPHPSTVHQRHLIGSSVEMKLWVGGGDGKLLKVFHDLTLDFYLVCNGFL